MFGLDLHAVVRGAITAVHPDETVLWYRSSGQKIIKGKLVPVYAPPVPLMAQVQSESDEKLYHSQKAGENDVTRAFYLRGTPEDRPAGIVRPLARGGDMFRRERDGTWWLVTGTPEDSSGAGWCKVRVTLQVNGPYLSASGEGEGA